MNDSHSNVTALKQPRILGDAQALVSSKIRPLFDADSVRQSGFAVFAEAWQTVVPLTRCYIAKFEYSKLDRMERTFVDSLIAARRMNILNCGTESDYGPIFGRLSDMKLQRVAMVTGSSSDIGKIAASANNSSSINVQYCYLTDDGMLATLFGTNHRKPKSRPEPTKPSLEPVRQPNGFIVATRPESIIVSALSRRSPLGIGVTVYTSQGESVLLKNEAMVNADSITYTTDCPGLWAKIYASKSLTTLTEEKCRRMLSKDIKLEGLCWPKDILYDEDGVFAGFIVSEAKGIPLSQCVFKGVENGIRRYFPNWDKRQLTQLTITILNKIIYMHTRGILFGCLNPTSILVKDEKNVYLTDTDHYQIEGFPCMVRNTMFTPPELQDKLRRNKMYLCTADHEKYTVALLIFMLMMPGKMPYIIEDSVHAPDSIIQQRFAFSYKGEHGSDRTVGSWRFVWSHLTSFKEIFFRTFQNGERLNAAECRPTDNRWLRLTSDFFEELNGKNLYDPHSRELVPKSFKRSRNDDFVRCEYCHIEHPRSYFRDEYFAEYTICKTCLEEPSKISFTCVDCGRTFIYTNRTAIYHARKKKLVESYRAQKHCRDCKNKTVKCVHCGREVPLYKTNLSSGYCLDCENVRKNGQYTNQRCRDCGRYFVITVGEHEKLSSLGLNDPVRCKPCREARKWGRN